MSALDNWEDALPTANHKTIDQIESAMIAARLRWLANTDRMSIEASWLIDAARRLEAQHMEPRVERNAEWAGGYVVHFPGYSMAIETLAVMQEENR